MHQLGTDIPNLNKDLLQFKYSNEGKKGKSDVLAGQVIIWVITKA